jgi:hypothetical protein
LDGETLWYAFPTKLGQVTRGFPTAHAASPLKDELQADTDLPQVWAHKDGIVQGTSVEPFYKSATEAALPEFMVKVRSFMGPLHKALAENHPVDRLWNLEARTWD